QQDVNFVNKKGAVQSLIAITYALNFQPYNSDMVAANLMNSILGGYFSSRLNLNLREQKGFTYGINSKLQNDENIGSFFTSVNVRNEVTGQAIKEIIGEIRKLTEVKISEEELLQVKNVISGNFSRSIEDPKTIAKFALAIKKFGLPDDYFTTHLQKIASVSIEDIYNMARKYLQPDNLHIIVVGNEEEVIDQLAEIAKPNPVKIYDFEGNQINS
ncbi:MAG TPA: insulinase family protein, partial [Saprospiraceae bacterium]|nr:insulinase family protein [Saprospiraceae bacterium]